MENYWHMECRIVHQLLDIWRRLWQQPARLPQMISVAFGAGSGWSHHCLSQYVLKIHSTVGELIKIILLFRPHLNIFIFRHVFITQIYTFYRSLRHHNWRMDGPFHEIGISFINLYIQHGRDTWSHIAVSSMLDSDGYNW